MLSIVRKCRLTFIISFLITVVICGNKDTVQGSVVIAAPATKKITQSLPITNNLNSTITTQSPFNSTVVISPTIISHNLNGIGVHMFDDDYRNQKFNETLDTLGLKYLRIQFGPYWDDERIPAPPACNDASYDTDREMMYNFIKQNFNGDYPVRLENAKSISAIAKQRGVKIIFLNWRAHKSWLTDPTFHELKEEYVDDYACFVTTTVRYLKDEEIIISYVEPTNEPSDTKDTKIPPELYNTFVKLVRKYLDRAELSHIKMLGPALAYLNHDNTCKTYVDALDNEGVNAISAWTAHAWDPKFFSAEREVDILRMRFEEFRNCVKGRELPGDPKPIFITEYACVKEPSNGVCAIENLVTLLDKGANIAVYWHLKEQSWALDQPEQDRALLDKIYKEKPIFTATSSLLPFISGNQVEVLETQVDGRITAASFSKKVNELIWGKQLIVVLINNYPEAENILINLEEPGMIGTIDGAVYDGKTNSISENLDFVQCENKQCELTLPPNTTMTLVFKTLPYYLPTIILSR